MSFGFREPASTVKKAIEHCVLHHKILFLAAASNEGRNGPMYTRFTFPAAYSHLVIPVISTNHLGRLSDFNPPAPRGCELFATLGENVPVRWPTVSSGERVMSGTSTATCLAAGLVACLLEFIRTGVETAGETGRPIDPTWANIHTLEGMKAVLRLMAPDEASPYLTPWRLQELAPNKEAILARIYNEALKNV